MTQFWHEQFIPEVQLCWLENQLIFTIFGCYCFDRIWLLWKSNCICTDLLDCSSFVDDLTTSKIDEYFAPTIATIMYFEVLWENLSSAYLLAYLTFFQILWKSRCNILVTWLEKLNCGFLHSFQLWKNTTKQLFQSKFQCRK